MTGAREGIASPEEVDVRAGGPPGTGPGADWTAPGGSAAAACVEALATPLPVLVYTPSYTIDRDPQSLRISMFMGHLAAGGWRFDVVTSPVFFRDDVTLRARLDGLRETAKHVRVFQTHPGAVAALRHALFRAKRRTGGTAGGSSAIAGAAADDPVVYRVARSINRAYERASGRLGDPDWIVPAVLCGLRLNRTRSYRVVFASASSYFASHVAAATVCAATGLPLVLDYGDPWTRPEVSSRWIDRALEAWVLRVARTVVVTTERAKTGILTTHPFLDPDRIEILTQGYPDQQPRTDEPCPGVAAGDRSALNVVYTGSFYSGLNSPVAFLEAVRRASASGARMRFLRAGPEPPREQMAQMRARGLDAFMHDLGYVSHEQALALQRKADVLLVIGTDSHDQLPGKVYEYIGAGRPILALCERPDDLAGQVVRHHGLGLVVPNRADAIGAALARLYGLWQRCRLDSLYHPADTVRFSWQHLARRLGDLLLDASATGGTQRARRVAAAGSRAGLDPRGGAP